MKKLIGLILIFTGCSQVREVESTAQIQPEKNKTAGAKSQIVFKIKPSFQGFKVVHGFKAEDK